MLVDSFGDRSDNHAFRVHPSIAPELADMLEAAAKDGIILKGWGWRSNERQIELRKDHCGTSHYAIYEMPASRCSPPTAKPGRSMHLRGTAIDFTLDGEAISTRRSPAYVWLNQHAGKYGLYNLPSEPWHWSVNGN